MRRRFLLPLILLLLFVSSVLAQTPAAEIEIVSTDTGAFPIISVQLVARDADGNALTALDGLQLSEGGRPINAFDINSITKGVDVLFVIDANSEIERIDLVGDVSRLAKVRTVIADFANREMSRSEQDRVSVIVPGADGAEFLVRDAIDPDAVSDAIGAFVPEELPDTTPLDAVLREAFAHAAQQEDDGRYQAVVLFTDGGQLADQLDYDALIELAEDSNTRFFGVILGNIASDAEVANVLALAEPTGGRFVHMPQTERIEPLFETLAGNRDVNTLRYRSQLTPEAEPVLEVALGDATTAFPLDVTILPPVIALQDADQPLILPDPASAETIDPTIRLTANVSWPDGYVRTLTAATLIIDGEEQPLLRPPVLDPLGVLTFDWDPSDLDPGPHTFAVSITDELGLTVQSDSAERLVQIGPTVTEAHPTPTPTPAPTPTPTPLEAGLTLLRDDNTQRLIRWVLFGLAAVLVAIVAVRLRRRRRRNAPAPPPPPPEPQPIAAPEAAHQAATNTETEDDSGLVYVYFEPIRNAPEYSGAIPITRNVTKIGSDRRHVNLLLSHDTVGRYHARLLYANGAFLLYDEGTPNGTVVNGKRIALEPHTLQDGDLVQLGRVRLRFRIVEK